MRDKFEDTMNMIQQDSYVELAKKSISLLNDKKRIELFDCLVREYFSELENSFCSVHDIDLIKRK